jgi:hypothetical protein
MPLTIFPCTCYNFSFVIVVFDLGDYVVQVYNVLYGYMGLGCLTKKICNKTSCYLQVGILCA